jgi:hypothetical protein
MGLSTACYRDSFTFLQSSDRLYAPPPPQLLIQLEPRIKQLGHGADHSHQSCADIENEWIYSSTPPIPFQGMILIGLRGSFTFISV